MHFNEQCLYKINVRNGMTNLLKRSSSKPWIGNYYLIQGIKKFKGKLTTCWMGPYEVVTTFHNRSIEIKTIDDA